MPCHPHPASLYYTSENFFILVHVLYAANNRVFAEMIRLGIHRIFDRIFVVLSDAYSDKLFR